MGTELISVAFARQGILRLTEAVPQRRVGTKGLLEKWTVIISAPLRGARCKHESCESGAKRMHIRLYMASISVIIASKQRFTEFSVK